MKSRKAKKVLLAVGMSSLCLAIQAPCMNMESYAAQADMTKNEGDTVIGIEEYGKGSDWTGWFTVTIRVLLPDGQTPAKDVFITMNPKYPAEPDYSNDQAGHGPNINGITEYKTDENGELMFRIYPSPVEYLVRVPAGSEWSAKNYAIGSITQDNSTITIVLEKEVKPSEPETKPSEPETKPNPGGGSSGGGGGSSNKGNGGNDQNNGPGVTKPDNGNNQTNPPQEPDQPQKPNVPGQQPGTDKPSNPTGPETPEPDRSNDYVLPGKDLETGTKDDVTVKPGKDENGNNNSSMDKDGKVELPDGGSVIHPTEPDRGEIRIDVPKGTVVNPDGSIKGKWTESNSIYVDKEKAGEFRRYPDGGTGSWKQTDDGRYWYERADGTYPQNAWEELSDRWYYFDESGYMKTGWIDWEGRAYYCTESGEMLKDAETPDGQRVGSDGAKIEKSAVTGAKEEDPDEAMRKEWAQLQGDETEDEDDESSSGS